MHAAIALPAPVILPSLVASSIVTSPEANAGPQPLPPMILHGRDDRGKPHASRLVGMELADVEQAARLMGYSVTVAETVALIDLAGLLPAGRLFPASGKAFVPFCSAKLYSELLAATGLTDAPRPLKAAGKATEAGGSGGSGQGSTPGGAGAGDPPATRVGAKAPNEWSEIGLGSVVLAHDEEDGGFYAAKIMTTKAHDSFTLKWAFFPDLPEFSRARRELALMHPETVAKLA